MFQNFRRNFSTMPISLSEWRVRIGTFLPSIPLIQCLNLIRMKLFLALLYILADGESKVEPSKKETSPTTTDHQSSSDKTPSNPEKDVTSSGVSNDEQKTPTATADQTKDRLFKGSKKKKHHNQKGRSGPDQSCGAFLSFRCFLNSGASPLLRFLLLVFATILLLRSGDVELNPGPNESSVLGVSDKMLVDIAGALPMDITRLGVQLKTSQPDIERHLATNRMDGTVTSKGTHQMLVDWRNRTRMQYQQTELREALVSSSFQNVADRYLPQGQVGEHIPTLTEEEINRVADEVKRYLSFELCQIQADPLNSEILLQFERIFTNLTLMEEGKDTRHKSTPLPYDKLLKTKVNGFYPNRLLVEGEGGVGKTTLCAKIAWDWIHGVGYQDFKLVLVILLRKATNRTVGEIVKSYLSDDNPVTAKQLDKYILTHPDEVFLVLDGLDELAADLGSVQQLIQIILNRLFKSGTVLITSRQWRSDEIRKNPDLRKVFAFIAIEGFSTENLASYITKFFHPDKASSEDLNRFISDNDVIRENMAPFPIYTAMLCIMWKEFDGERRKAMCKLQTFSQLFSEMIGFLVDHYLSKHVTPSTENKVRSDIRYHLNSIGCVAFQGLQDRRLVFTEEEFQGSPESVNIGCKVGVLTKEKRIPSRRERKYYSPSAVSSVQFPHKLFQEYLSGMYLASLYNSNRNEYDRLIADLIIRASEYQYLLYFTSAQQKEVGLDIASRLINSRTHAYDDFIVDVAYESQNPAVAKAVADHLHGRTLEIGKKMQAHTVSGHVFVLEHREVDNLSIEKSCGRTASEDLAESMCSSPSLRSVTIKKAMHDVFYYVLANQAVHSTIKTLDITHSDLGGRPSASRDLAQFICKMPHLKNLTLGNPQYQVFLHDDFYSTSSSMASSAKIKTLNIRYMDLRERPSASRDLAQFICKVPHLKNLTHGSLEYQVSLHDVFYSTAASMASSAKIETLNIDYEDIRERPSPSRDLAQFICKMPHLKNLTLGSLGYHVVLLHDDFFSTSASMASSAKIETLDIRYMDLIKRPSASRDLAQLICKMPHLRNMTLHARCHDDFYSTSASVASSAKTETLNIDYEDLRERPFASRSLAQFICKMPHLKNLTHGSLEYRVSLPDDFYLTSASLASSAKIETLNIDHEDLRGRPSASRDLARFICKMPHLKNLTLSSQHQVLLHDAFFSTTASMASSAKIETLNIDYEDLRERPFASRSLAQFICKMPHLKNLTHGSLGYHVVLLHDDFYVTSASMASSAKIETLNIDYEDLRGRLSASRDLARFICKMPHLKNLTLGSQHQVLLHDAFYSTAASMASSAKIEILHIYSGDLRKRPSASRDLAQFICKMPHLKNLTLESQYLQVLLHDDFYSTSSSMASSVKVGDQSANTCLTLTDLTMNDQTLQGWQDCGSMFDRVLRFTLQVWGEIDWDIIQRIKLPGTTELTVQHVKALKIAYQPAGDPAKLSSAITNAFPNLVKVTFSDLRIGNSMMESILQTFRTNRNLKQLRFIRFTRCGTDERVDALIREFNEDQIMKVEIEHGKPHGRW